MDKSIIAIDVDDVLSPVNERMMRFINERYGKDFKLKDYLVEGSYRGYWARVWNVGKEEADRWYNSFIESDSLRTVGVMDGAVEAIKELQKKYHLIIVSARFGSQIEDTHRWLNVHFPRTFKHIEFVPLWYTNPTHTKAKIAKELNADYLIDDNPEHCTLAAEEGIQSLLFGDYGWNKNVDLPNGVTRIKDWQAVLEYFNGRG